MSYASGARSALSIFGLEKAASYNVRQQLARLSTVPKQLEGAVQSQLTGDALKQHRSIRDTGQQAAPKKWKPPPLGASGEGDARQQYIDARYGQRFYGDMIGRLGNTPRVRQTLTEARMRAPAGSGGAGVAAQYGAIGPLGTKKEVAQTRAMASSQRLGDRADKLMGEINPAYTKDLGATPVSQRLQEYKASKTGMEKISISRNAKQQILAISAGRGPERELPPQLSKFKPNVGDPRQTWVDNRASKIQHGRRIETTMPAEAVMMDPARKASMPFLKDQSLYSLEMPAVRKALAANPYNNRGRRGPFLPG